MTHKKFDVPSASDSLVLTTKLKAQGKYRAGAILFFYIQQK